MAARNPTLLDTILAEGAEHQLRTAMAAFKGGQRQDVWSSMILTLDTQTATTRPRQPCVIWVARCVLGSGVACVSGCVHVCVPVF